MTTAFRTCTVVTQIGVRSVGGVQPDALAYWCSRCEEQLPASAFIPSQRKRTGATSGWCKPCRAAAAREKRARIRAERQAQKDALAAAGVKVCAQCQVQRPHADFHRDQRRSDGLFPYCKPCRIVRDGRSPRPARQFRSKREYDKDRLARMDAAQRTTRSRRQYLWYHYRVTLEQYEAMLDSQGGCCAICRRPETSTSSKFGGDADRLAVDHDHACCDGITSCGSCIRGLLCRRCNAGLGNFGDDLAGLQRAMDYLRG